MARPKKNFTLEEREQIIREKIKKAEDELKAMKEELAEVLKEKENAFLKELRSAIEDSGKSVSEWIAEMKEKK